MVSHNSRGRHAAVVALISPVAFLPLELDHDASCCNLLRWSILRIYSPS